MVNVKFLTQILLIALWVGESTPGQAMNEFKDTPPSGKTIHMKDEKIPEDVKGDETEETFYWGCEHGGDFIAEDFSKGHVCAATLTWGSQTRFLYLPKVGVCSFSLNAEEKPPQFCCLHQCFDGKPEKKIEKDVEELTLLFEEDSEKNKFSIRIKRSNSLDKLTLKGRQ
jgi:hypothetical protein